MASPSSRKVRGKYTGNGNIAAREIVVGFQPQKVSFLSVEGQAWHVDGQATHKKVGGNAPAALSVGQVAVAELKFVVASTDDTLNKNNVVYYYEAEE